MRILVVDDNTALVGTLVEYLSAFHRVDGFDDSPSALHAFTDAFDIDDPYDIVVTDYDMPTWNGLDLAEALDSVSPEIPVIVMTGSCDRSCLESRFVKKVLNKPFSLTTLRDSIANISPKP